MHKLSNRQAVGGFNRREQNAVSWIYQKLYPTAYEQVLKLTNLSADAEDITANAFVKLLEHTQRFRTLKKIQDFFNSTVRNSAIDWRRHRDLVIEKEPEILNEWQQDIYHPLHVEDWRDGSIAILYRYSEKLPERWKPAFELYYIKGLRNKEIAEKLGLSRKDVANVKSRSVVRLKVMMKKDGYLLICIIYFL